MVIMAPMIIIVKRTREDIILTRFEEEEVKFNKERLSKIPK